MRKLLLVLLLGITIFATSFSRPALAADAAKGGKLFSANCVACHMGGRNNIAPDKTLQQDALEKNGKDSLEAIVSQVTNGKNAMPSFKGRLTPTQIEDVAAYVLQQAEKGWS